jgi:hypothetical protein
MEIDSRKQYYWMRSGGKKARKMPSIRWGGTIEVFYNPDEPEENITTWEKVTASDAITILLILIVSLAFLYVWSR